MKHLVTTFGNVSLYEARRQLSAAHDYLVSACIKSLASIPVQGPLWGIHMKRLRVAFGEEDRPAIVRKDSERLGEVINMVATLERLIPVLAWFAEQPEFRELVVTECHPSTSSKKGSNDLMLQDAQGNVVVRCEVCDVASSSAAQNGKETSDLKNLGCADGVPADGIRRFICTSPEFASAIQSTRRKWQLKMHRYQPITLGDEGDTILIELLAVPLVSA